MVPRKFYIFFSTIATEYNKHLPLYILVSLNFHSERLYRAFIARVLLLTVVAALEFTYFSSSLLPAITKSVDFKCTIGYTIKYECTGHPGQFYEYLGRNTPKKILAKAGSGVTILF